MLDLNNVYNVDCLTYMSNLPNNCIDCIYTDVPYLYSKGGMSNSSRLSQSINKMNNDLKQLNIVDGFDYETFFYHCFRILKGCNLFIWCSSLQIPLFLKCISKYTDKVPIILVWCKTNPIPATNNNWLSDVEYCLCLRFNTCKLNDGYNLKSRFYLSPINTKDKILYDHPTIKPLELVKKHILHSTRENDIVFDPFIGSGTTAVACLETNRKFLGCEIDSNIYKSCLNRINGYNIYDLNLKKNGQMSLDI